MSEVTETRQCNDNGDHGVCTFCGHLHAPRTVDKFVLGACFVCSKPVDRPDDDHCPKCIEKMLAGKP